MHNANQPPEVGSSQFRYDVPYYYGGPKAIESISSIAAPLLAGGAFAFIGIVLQQQDALRFPGVALLVSLAALLALIFSVQCGYWARQHSVMPWEIEQWWPDLPEHTRLQRVRADWWQERADYLVWARRARLLFGAGVTLVWLTLCIAALPIAADRELILRWVAASFCLVASILEAVWLMVSSKPMRSTIVGRALSGPVVTPPPFAPPESPGSDPPNSPQSGAT
jgi:hypothetical protein